MVFLFQTSKSVISLQAVNEYRGLKKFTNTRKVLCSLFLVSEFRWCFTLCLFIILLVRFGNEKLTFFIVLRPTPDFPRFHSFVRCKSGVTFVRRCFRDVHVLIDICEIKTVTVTDIVISSQNENNKVLSYIFSTNWKQTDNQILSCSTHKICADRDYAW